MNNFFDAVGTVRMEAFISPMGMTRFDDYPDEQDEMPMVNTQGKNSRERKRRSRNRDSNHYSGRGRTSDDWYGGSRTAGEEEYHDPFRGF